MNALGIAAGVCAVISLCALSYWIGRRVQAAADFDALAEALRPPEGADELASDHWGGSVIEELTNEIAALRKDLDDALLALRHLRSCQHRPPTIDHDSEHWWQAAVEEADAVLARFEGAK